MIIVVNGWEEAAIRNYKIAPELLFLCESPLLPLRNHFKHVIPNEVRNLLIINTILIRKYLCIKGRLCKEGETIVL
jgi:hypothetical protein